MLGKINKNMGTKVCYNRLWAAKVLLAKELSFWYYLKIIKTIKVRIGLILTVMTYSWRSWRVMKFSYG
jgi:hypothetical protein